VPPQDAPVSQDPLVSIDQTRQLIAANIEAHRLAQAGGVSPSIGNSVLLGRHLDALDQMQKINEARDNASRTTPRFRVELLTFLLDTPTRGPILEVGTYTGGTTCLLAYVAAVTGRHVFGFDIDHGNIQKAQASCRLFGLGNHATILLESLADFFSRGGIRERPDLLFLDSDHGYAVTKSELAVIHGANVLLPRCIAFHDFNYRIRGQETQLAKPGNQNPVGVNLAVFDFYRTAPSSTLRPMFKRFGALSGDGTTTTPATAPNDGDAYIEDHGTEGMMAFHF
jgi:hypothetical protein